MCRNWFQITAPLGKFVSIISQNGKLQNVQFLVKQEGNAGRKWILPKGSFAEEFVEKEKRPGEVEERNGKGEIKLVEEDGRY